MRFEPSRPNPYEMYVYLGRQNYESSRLQSEPDLNPYLNLTLSGLGYGFNDPFRERLKSDENERKKLEELAGISEFRGQNFGDRKRITIVGAMREGRGAQFVSSPRNSTASRWRNGPIRSGRSSAPRKSSSERRLQTFFGRSKSGRRCGTITCTGLTMNRAVSRQESSNSIFGSEA